MIITPKEFGRNIVEQVFSMSSKDDFDEELYEIFVDLSKGGSVVRAVAESYGEYRYPNEGILGYFKHDLDGMGYNEIEDFVNSSKDEAILEIYRQFAKNEDCTYTQAMLRVMYIMPFSYNIYGKYNQCAEIFHYVGNGEKGRNIAFEIAEVLDRK